MVCSTQLCYYHVCHICFIKILLYSLAPLVKAKQALVKLKQEMTQMDIRMGVVQHILLQAKLKERHEQNRAIGGAVNINTETAGFAI